MTCSNANTSAPRDTVIQPCEPKQDLVQEATQHINNSVDSTESETVYNCVVGLMRLTQLIKPGL